MTTTGSIWKIDVVRTGGFPGGAVIWKGTYPAEDGYPYIDIIGIPEQEYYRSDIDHIIRLQYQNCGSAWYKELIVSKDLYDKVEIGDMVYIQTGLDGWEE